MPSAGSVQISDEQSSHAYCNTYHGDPSAHARAQKWKLKLVNMAKCKCCGQEITGNIKCRRCKLAVGHLYANGLCNACYYREYMKGYRKASTPVKIGVVKS
jgi:hypothetical protein